MGALARTQVDRVNRGKERRRRYIVRKGRDVGTKSNLIHNYRLLTAMIRIECIAVYEPYNRHSYALHISEAIGSLPAECVDGGTTLCIVFTRHR